MPLPNSSRKSTRTQGGASLLEALVAILILSFGLLAIGGMMAYAVQLPKIAGNRASAMAIGTDLVERMRANIPGFTSGQYTTALTYNGGIAIPANPSSAGCTYPNCSAASLATLDLNWAQFQARAQLPGGGYRIENLGNQQGNLWILWQEPNNFGSYATKSSDNCPNAAAAFTNPQPRCVFIPFRL